MRRALFRALLLCVVLAAGPVRADETGGLLWRLEPPGGGAPSWLYGTMHVADPRVATVPPEVRQAIGQSEIAVFELLDDDGTNATVMKATLYSGGRRLTDVLTPAEWEQVKAVASGYGMIPTVTAMFRPFGLLMMFSMPVDQTKLLLSHEALDVMLMRTAADEGLALRALETAEEQIAVFAGIPEPEQVVLLMDLVAHKAENDDAFDALLEAYVARDLGRIAAEVETMTGGPDAALYDRLMERLKTQRDALMFERLQPMLAEGRLFVAVGALHLTGEGGLLDRFRRAGWSVVAADGPPA